jgi:hypothetical protein
MDLAAVTGETIPPASIDQTRWRVFASMDRDARMVAARRRRDHPVRAADRGPPLAPHRRMRTSGVWTVIALCVLDLVGCATDDAPARSATVDGGSLQAPHGSDAALEPDEVVSETPVGPGRERAVIYRFLDQGDLASADKIVGNLWPVNRYADAQLAWPLTWTENPYDEKYWRFIFHGMRPLAHLLWAYRTTGEVRYRDKLLGAMESFVGRAVDSPYLWDEHTTAYRTMMLVNIEVTLAERGDLSPALADALRAEIARHGAFLADPDHYEPGYNHGLAEAAALLLVADVYPELPSSAAWRALAVDRLATLLDEAVDPDGVEVEQSPYYHFYFLTGFWDLYRWASARGIELAPGVDGRVRSMLRYAAHIVLPDGTLPLMGASLARNVRQTRDGHYEEMAALSPELEYVLSAGARGSRPPERHILFPSSGQAILHSLPAARLRDDSHVLVDVGPYRTSHSHLDALAVHLYAAGRPQLVDPGLFSYEAGPWHDYFRGTGAHNTVVVDGGDQREGTAAAGLGRQGPGWAYQSGRHQLYDGVEHRRGVALVDTDRVLVIDELRSTTERTYEQAWHLPPAATLVVSGLDATSFFGTAAGVAIRQLAPAGVTLEQRHGALDPIDGWYSARYEERVPTHALRYRVVGRDVHFVTLLAAGKQVPLAIAASAERRGRVWVVTLCGAQDQRYRVTIRNLGAGAGEAISVDRGARCR